ncbi:hypothetical protein INR49_029250 [Caranx melampygus]|nr:hypothetical protein INR49_029250 [Caranx melampygus]
MLRRELLDARKALRSVREGVSGPKSKKQRDNTQHGIPAPTIFSSTQSSSLAWSGLPPAHIGTPGLEIIYSRLMISHSRNIISKWIKDTVRLISLSTLSRQLKQYARVKPNAVSVVFGLAEDVFVFHPAGTQSLTGTHRDLVRIRW